MHLTEFRHKVEAAATLTELNALERQIPDLFKLDNTQGYAHELTAVKRKEFMRNGAPEGNEGTDIYHILSNYFNH